MPLNPFSINNEDGRTQDDPPDEDDNDDDDDRCSNGEYTPRVILRKYMAELLDFADVAYSGSKAETVFVEHNFNTIGKCSDLKKGEPFFTFFEFADDLKRRLQEISVLAQEMSSMPEFYAQ